MQRQRKNSLKLFLQLLKDEELEELYRSFGKKDALEGYSRAFIIKKIDRSIDLKTLLENDYAVRLLLDKMGDLVSLFEAYIRRLDIGDLTKMYRQFGKEKPLKEDMKKSEIVKDMFVNIPLLELMKSKLLRERLKPKYVSVSDIKTLRKEIESTKTNTERLSSNLGLISTRIASMDHDLKGLSEKLESVEDLFNVGATPDLLSYLKAFYDEAVLMDERLSPESFQSVSQRLQEKLKIDQRTFMLKGIELLVAHYFLTRTKSLLWKPSLESFMKILKEEFEKVKMVGDQAEIPKLRTFVTRRMGISDVMFDHMLESAWKEDRVKLDVGAPIGEYDVKYLVTEDGNKFYYVKLKR